jgi:phosphate transport system substrate-binding protein
MPRTLPTPRTASLIGAGLMLLLASGCGGAAGPGGGSSGTREVIVDGSSTVFPISQAAQEGYAEVDPKARVIVDNHGTGGGFGRYIEGEVDIVDASRLAKQKEEEDAWAKGFDWTRFLVGHDGITVVVHPSNDFVKALTVDQLKALFAVDSKVGTWKELDPSWPDRKINLYTPDNDSGTYEFFAEAIVGGKAHRSEGVQPSSDDNTLVQGASGDPDGLAYFGYAYYAENKERLKVVPIIAEAGAEPVTPSPETIYSKAYKPLSRPLYIYAKNKALATPEARGFVTYYLENVAKLAEQAGYVAPTEEERQFNLDALAGHNVAPTDPGAD